MKRLVLALCAIMALVCAQVVYSDVIRTGGVNTELIPLMTNGPADERINIVFVPEFYGNRRSEFVADVDLIKDALFEVEPFKTYKKRFNTSAIWMTFDESPVLPMLYFCGYVNDIGRCINYDNMYLSRNIVGRYYPVKNTAIVFLTYNAGSGFGDWTSGWPNGPICYTEVGMIELHDSTSFPLESVFHKRSLVHEFGHAFGLLGDEYTNTATPKRARGDELTEDGRIFPNLTFESRRDRIRWKNWIEPTTPMPTPDTPVNRNMVGAFESAMGYTYGIFRPMSACMMNNASSDTTGDKDPFCVVCREYLTKSISKFSVNLEGTDLTVGNTSTTFRADLVSGIGMGLEVKWMVDSTVVSSRVVSSGADSFRVNENDISIGTHTIRVEVRDTTSFVRSDPQRLLVESYEWQVVSTPQPDFNNDGRVNFEDFFLFGDAFGGNVAENPNLRRFDLDSDGEIGFADFFLFADSFRG
jgi:hypothetical protein